MASSPPPPPAAVPYAASARVTTSSGTQIASAARGWVRQISHESLGTQTMEGITVDGTRTTITLPEGSVGNDRPITTVTETWNSPELKIMVLSKNSDPRYGESTTKLTNISRSDPDPALFQVPSDYTIQDQPQPTF